MRKAAVNVARMVLALTFILSGFVKAVDPLGTQYKINDYLTALQLRSLAPDMLTLSAAVALPACEFLIGICLLFAIHRRMVARVTLAVMTVMTALTLWLALANPVSDCGCFGDALVLTNWQTFAKNVVLLAAAVVVWRWPTDMARMISLANQWIVFNYSMLFIVILSGWCLYDLPIFDFRPYHIGTDLRGGWQRMIDGEDSPYADLFIEETQSGDDITEEVLANEGYTFLLVSPHLELADDSRLDRINQIYEYSREQGYPFYCLTASGQRAISRWQDLTGAEYPFCQTDEIALKTIIRSNPGLLLMHDGKIIGKWSHNALPQIGDEATALPLERLEAGQMPTDTVAEKIARILLWFVLPLLVLTIADRLWAWTKWVRREKGEVKSEK